MCWYSSDYSLLSSRALAMKTAVRSGRCELPQPIEPIGHADAGAGADWQNRRRRIDLADTVDIRVEIDVQVWHQIDLVEQHYVDGAEHHRVLQRFVVTFGDRINHRLGVFADVEFGRAHQISDVLDNHQVEAGQVQSLQCAVDHGCVEVAFAAESIASVEQGYLGAPTTEFGGVQVGGDVALDHSDGDLAGEFVEGGLQYRRLPGARGTHQVDRTNTIVFKRISVKSGPDIVLGENRLQHVDTLSTGVIAAMIAVVVRMGVGVIAVLVGMHGSVIVPMKSTHRQHLSRDIQ